MSLREMGLSFGFGALMAVGVWSFRDAVAAPDSVPVLPAADSREPGHLSSPPLDVDVMGESATSEPSARASIPGTAPALTVVAMGQARDQHGEILRGIAPRFEDKQAHVLEARSGPDGTWSLHGLTPGEWEIRADLPGVLPYREHVVVPGTQHWRHDLTLERARSLPVRFETEDGKIIPMERRSGDVRSFLGVCATKERPTSPLPGVWGRVVGHYGEGVFRSRAERGTPPGLDPRYQGLLELASDGPLWVSVTCRDVVLESRPLANAEQDLVFVIRDDAFDSLLGELHVRVVERGTNIPIEEGVRLSNSSGGIRGKPACIEGTWVFSEVPAGRMELSIHSGEWERLVRGVRVTGGSTVDLGTIALGRNQDFDVRVQDEDGNPLDVTVKACRPELAGRPGDMDLRISTAPSAEGVSAISWLAPGWTLIRAGGEAGWARVAQLVDTRRVEEVRLVLPRGTEVVFKRVSDGEAGSEYAISNGDGLQFYEGRVLPAKLFMLPGRYTLRRLVDGIEVGARAFEVSQERTVVSYGEF